MPRARSTHPPRSSPRPPRSSSPTPHSSRRPPRSSSRPPRSSRLDRGRVLRVAAWAVASIVVLLTVMVLILLVAMRRNDAAIEAHLGTATAVVLTVGLLRTGVEFVTAQGLTVRPPGGVLYPGLLSPGQKFLVDYSTVDPDLVRVAGRTAAVGNLVIAILLVAIWGIGGALAYLLRRWSGLPMWRPRRVRAEGAEQVGPDAADPPEPVPDSTAD